jgi:hypothetical protein
LREEQVNLFKNNKWKMEIHCNKSPPGMLPAGHQQRLVVLISLFTGFPTKMDENFRIIEQMFSLLLPCCPE